MAQSNVLFLINQQHPCVLFSTMENQLVNITKAKKNGPNEKKLEAEEQAPDAPAKTTHDVPSCCTRIAPGIKYNNTTKYSYLQHIALTCVHT